MMTDEKITEALDAAEKRIMQESPRMKPERLHPEAHGKATIGALRHCLWMVGETKRLLSEAKMFLDTKDGNNTICGRCAFSRKDGELLEVESLGSSHYAALCRVCDKDVQAQRDSRREKVMRWLGFIQGGLWAHGIQTIEVSKNDNKPDETSGS
jgi:hypothetical protein